LAYVKEVHRQVPVGQPHFRSFRTFVNCRSHVPVDLVYRDLSWHCLCFTCFPCRPRFYVQPSRSLRKSPDTRIWCFLSGLSHSASPCQWVGTLVPPSLSAFQNTSPTDLSNQESHLCTILTLSL